MMRTTAYVNSDGRLARIQAQEATSPELTPFPAPICNALPVSAWALCAWTFMYRKPEMGGLEFPVATSSRRDAVRMNRHAKPEGDGDEGRDSDSCRAAYQI